MDYWWVNQGNTAYNRHAMSDLWAPYRDLGNKRQSHWESMDDMAVGDIILHYAKGWILGVSRVRAPSYPIVRPPEFEVKGRAGDAGRRVLAEDFQQLDVPVEVEVIPLDTRLEGREPFATNGAVRHGYVFRVTPEVARIVFEAANILVSADDPRPIATEPDDQHRELVLVYDETNGTTVTGYRKEQGALRDGLIGRQSHAPCGFCGKVYPVQLLHTAHIKPRSHATHDERLDFANVMLACLAGCDALFEKGYIHLTEDGTIASPVTPPKGSALESMMTPLLGRSAPTFRPGNSGMFRWKREQLKPLPPV